MNLILLGGYATALFAAALVGAWLPRRFQMTHTRLQMTLSLVSGLMLGVAFLHLIPHSAAEVSHIDFTMYWVVAGLVFTLLMLRLFHVPHHEPVTADSAHLNADVGPESGCQHHAHSHESHGHGGAVSWVALLTGLSIHTVVDGVALGAAMHAEGHGAALLGLGVFTAIMLHKPLDGLSIETLMTTAGCSTRLRQVTHLWFAMLCPVTAVTFYGLGSVTGGHGPLLPAALAFSAGAFICIALSDLLPEVKFHSHDRVILTLFFFIGLALAWGIGIVEQGH